MGSRESTVGSARTLASASSFLEQTCRLGLLIGSNREIRSRNNFNREKLELRFYFFVDLIDILALLCTLSRSQRDTSGPSGEQLEESPPARGTFRRN